MVGWLIAAGLVGAALASSGNSRTDYSSKIPASHKRCNRCGSSNVVVYTNNNGNGYVRLLFGCRHCGRTWGKSYFTR